MTVRDRVAGFLGAAQAPAEVASQPGGLYCSVTAVRLGALGWFEPAQVNFSFTTLIIGLALVTAARVMRQGVTMREELDVTI